MLGIIWMVTGFALMLIGERLLRRFAPKAALHRFTWQLMLVRFVSLILAGALVWWLFDVPGFMHQMQLLQAGDYEAAKHAYDPIIRLNW